jgi:hypothetical protein
MALDGNDLTPPGEEESAPVAARVVPAVTPADTTLSPDLVRNSPEFRALQEQNRILARKAGTADAAIAAARSEAESIRQAAEAERSAALAQTLRSTLGDDGLAFWNQLSEVSANDPVAAATLLAEWRAGGQTPVAATQKPAASAPQEGQQQMTPQAPAPLPSGLHADAPLGSSTPQESDEETVAAFDKKIHDLTERNYDPLTRNRVTTKERDEGIMAVFAKGVVGQIAARRGTRP